MNDITKNDYNLLVKKQSPPTKSYKTIPLAFIVGGLICLLGQFFINLYQTMGVSKDTAFTAASITLIFLATLATGLNFYDNIAKFGGAGTLVPITGFANAITAPALEFKSEGYILGLGAKLFAIVGPVIVYGIASGILYGAAVYLLKL